MCRVGSHERTARAVLLFGDWLLRKTWYFRDSFAIDAHSSLTLSSPRVIDRLERPSVPSALSQQHSEVLELPRQAGALAGARRRGFGEHRSCRRGRAPRAQAPRCRRGRRPRGRVRRGDPGQRRVRDVPDRAQDGQLQALRRRHPPVHGWRVRSPRGDHRPQGDEDEDDLALQPRG